MEIRFLVFSQQNQLNDRNMQISTAIYRFSIQMRGGQGSVSVSEWDRDPVDGLDPIETPHYRISSSLLAPRRAIKIFLLRIREDRIGP